MVSEVLNRMIKRAGMGYIEGVFVGSGRVTISHLHFADDTMIFCDADMRQVAYLCCVLTCFEAVSGLKINLAIRVNYSKWGKIMILKSYMDFGLQNWMSSSQLSWTPIGGKLQIKSYMGAGN